LAQTAAAGAGAGKGRAAHPVAREPPMILLRSLLWTLFFYLWCVLFAFVCCR